MVPTAGCSRLLFPARSWHKAQWDPTPISIRARWLQDTNLSLGATSTQSLGSSQLLEGHPAVLVPASPELGWKEWLWHLLSRLKFGRRVPVLFMQDWHVSLSWAMRPRFQPWYLQNITHVPAPPSGPWFQRDYSHEQPYPGLCRAGANPAAFSWFTPPLWRWKSDTGAAQQEKEDQPDASSVFSFHIPISTVTGAPCRRVCSPLPSGHCCTLGVKMRKNFGFGDLLLSSCYICKAHH